jgi:ParB family chromosome partitioning protein
MNGSEFEATEIALDRIIVEERLRDVDDAVAERIAFSLRALGQITPIEVRPLDEGKFQLVVGAHRLKAAQIAGFATIRAVIFDGDELTAKLREIDENLHRADLTPYDEASFLVARFNIWQEIDRISQHGGDRRSINWRDHFLQTAKLGKSKLNKRFAIAAAEMMGVSQDTVYRAIRRRNRLDSYWQDLQHTDAAQNGALLDKLAKLSVESLDAVMELVTEGHGVAAAIDLIAPKELPPPEPEKALLDAFVKAWRDPANEGHKSARAQVKKWAATQGALS